MSFRVAFSKLSQLKREIYWCLIWQVFCRVWFWRAFRSFFLFLTFSSGGGVVSCGCHLVWEEINADRRKLWQVTTVFVKVAKNTLGWEGSQWRQGCSMVSVCNFASSDMIIHSFSGRKSIICRDLLFCDFWNNTAVSGSWCATAFAWESVLPILIA